MHAFSIHNVNPTTYIYIGGLNSKVIEISIRTYNVFGVEKDFVDKYCNNDICSEAC